MVKALLVLPIGWPWAVKCQAVWKSSKVLMPSSPVLPSNRHVPYVRVEVQRINGTTQYDVNAASGDWWSVVLIKLHPESLHLILINISVFGNDQ